MGDAYFGNKNMRKASNCYKRAIEINPQKAEAYNGLGQIYNDSKGFKSNYNKALHFYNKAIDLEPTNAYYHRNKGITCFCLRNYSAAAQSYDAAIRLDPNESQFYYYKGKSLTEQKNLNEARICYEKALELKPNNLYKKMIGKSLAIVKQKLNQLENVPLEYPKKRYLRSFS